MSVYQALRLMTFVQHGMILMYRIVELSHLLFVNFSQITASDSKKLENSTHVGTTSLQIDIMDVNDERPKFENGNYKHTFAKI